MTSDQKPPSADLNALASEALDLWQEHLAMTASDPLAKAEMMKLMEPSRRLFVDWATMMQNGTHATGFTAKPTTTAAPAAPTAHGASTAAPASDDGALRLAQLAHRVAELEKRLDKLESGGRSKAAKDLGASTKPKSGV